VVPSFDDPAQRYLLCGNYMGSDDSRARTELGFSARLLREIVADTIRSLVQAGRLPPGNAGLLAEPR
jgi:hypothetical protein